MSYNWSRVCLLTSLTLSRVCCSLSFSKYPKINAPMIEYPTTRAQRPTWENTCAKNNLRQDFTLAAVHFLSLFGFDERFEQPQQQHLDVGPLNIIPLTHKFTNPQYQRSIVRNSYDNGNYSSGLDSLPLKNFNLFGYTQMTTWTLLPTNLSRAIWSIWGWSCLTI